MKKLLNSVKFISKALLLIILLLVGWAFINVANFIKGKKSVENKSGAGDLFGADKASADIPYIYDCNCPHVAYFDGKEFKIENDFLPAEFKAIEPGFAGYLYEQTVLSPDMLKFSSIPQKYNGELFLRLQEIELEESFIRWIKLLRVVHSEKEEILIDAVKKVPYLVSINEVKEKILLPSEVMLNEKSSLAGIYLAKQFLWNDIPESKNDLFQKGDSIDFTFKNLQKDKDVLLVVRSVYRDWMAGEEVKNKYSFSDFTRFPVLAKVAALAGLYFLSEHLPTAGGLALLPFVAGAGSQCKSIAFSYRNKEGGFNPLVIQKPRSFRQSTEVISIPKEAVGEDDSMVIRADFTKRHRLSFVGTLQGLEMNAAGAEELSVKNARHSRLGDVTLKISGKEKKVTHLIPGDTVDVSFEEPSRLLLQGQKETYLFQSAGFYSALRPEYKKAAGNWTEKLSCEAKEHYKKLVEINSYS
ncbi:MAG: hypothetical protein A3G49_02520 [Candidatus Sungbacteria bacterium RIFCSPLOWO2_12_FULL_41_11]|uniref:Uncharacterized protein n=1 Tax=Candidatus Sungbacteria bacterium RIFCSPLOWO2_12_FULL_41_11 TaxID=1802286 RepID=A0A1G2LNM8_9BACT|nr:MAG: hypothetical protein UV01_C0004G0093 [Parcubacteria group bacterium GW2011_GWA2_42_14]OGZ97970.1 MAG: hypothetical protein A3D41_04515 [Candidatus Sungbacteria bacterium RIFCSPHIGHO2_02_FULL_41_12b]OHA13216.1 MAG: hypothetical protein A3G49_02520 [Candidatus Sungbacteria bacterium RIFCSPLOWO2_12_FULL_41_11]